MRNLRPLLHSLRTNLMYKTLSLICGITFWLIWGQTAHTSRSFTVPLTFYNQQQLSLQAPESIRVTLAGTRRDLQALDREQLTIPIDCSYLPPGDTIVNLTHQHLLLPDHLKVIYYEPSNIVVKVL